MPAPLPKEIRDRFTRLIEEGLSGRDASRRLQLSAATGARWRRQIHISGFLQTQSAPAKDRSPVLHIGLRRNRCRLRSL